MESTCARTHAVLRLMLVLTLIIKWSSCITQTSIRLSFAPSILASLVSVTTATFAVLRTRRQTLKLSFSTLIRGHLSSMSIILRLYGAHSPTNTIKACASTPTIGRISGENPKITSMNRLYAQIGRFQLLYYPMRRADVKIC